MKKILRNVYLFIITIVLCFGCLINVTAAEDCGDLDNNQCRVGERGPIKTAGNNNLSNLTSATDTTKEVVNNKNYYSSIGVTNDFGGLYFGSYKEAYGILYCMDAQYAGHDKLYAERFLLDTRLNKRLQAFDTAILSILTDGGNSILTNANNVSDYWARLFAIRAITYTFGYYSDAALDYKGALYAGLTVTNNWTKENPSIHATLNSALNAIGESSLKTFSGHSGYSYSGAPVDKAKEYYFKALNEAIDYLKSITTVKVDTKTEPEAGEIKTETIGNEEIVTRDIVHTIKVSGIPRNGTNEFYISGVKLKDGNQYEGLISHDIVEISINGNKYTGDQINVLTGNYNLLEPGTTAFDFQNETEIKITVRLKGRKTSNSNPILQCGQQPIEYYIDGKYKVGGIGKYGEYVATIWYSGISQEQRYIGIEKLDNDNIKATPWKSSAKFALIEACSCDDLIKACEDEIDGQRYPNMNGQACQQLIDSNCGECAILDVQCNKLGNNAACEKYAEECNVVCDTTFTTFECCDEKGELIVSTIDNHEVDISGPEDAKACFVNKIDNQCDTDSPGYTNCSSIAGVRDQKGNTYTSYQLKDNKYCSISCKEDYVMTMPTAKMVNAGRYFTFKAKVEGTKTCYTNTIQREQYNKDVIDAQVAVVNAYSNYLKWKALDEAPIRSRTDHKSASPCCSERYPCPTKDNPNKTCSRCTCDARDQTNTWIEYYVSGAQYVDHSVPESYKNYNTGTISVLTRNSTAGYDNDGHIEGYCNSGCCYATCYDGSDGSASILAANIDNGLASAISALRSAQANYKNVIQEFNRCSSWSEEINYDPDIYYDYEETYLNDFGLVGKMNESVSGISGNSWYCNSRVSSSGAETKANISDTKYDGCSLSGNSYRETSINYTYCDIGSGCKIVPAKVSDARYKKVVSNVTANYKPATLFYNIYPSGEITVNSSDNTVALENKLPVSLNTERGIYKYTVNIENLGEFYNVRPSNNLGRYVGASTAVVDPNKLEYACSYLVNITETEGWLCDFDDQCTDDCISNCVGPNCDNYCDGDDCIADCIGVGCIYDSGAGSSLIEKTVSLNKLFPNGTNSYNWDISKNNKASSTVSEIEEKGNAIYDEKPILSLTIDASTAKAIRNYNDDVESVGGYSNSTISCSSVGEYKELACYSVFITDILEGNYGDNVVNDNSLLADESYRTENSGYFKLWNGTMSEENMIGPAWK